jgi:hypothetical protein
MATGTRATPITMAEKLNANAELVVDDTRRASPPRLQRRPTLGLYKQSSPSPVPTSAGSVRSQCHRTRYPTMSIGKLTTKRFPRSSVDRPEQQAICPRSPTPRRGSRPRTLFAILKPSPPGREFQPRGTCSKSYSTSAAHRGASRYCWGGLLRRISGFSVLSSTRSAELKPGLWHSDAKGWGPVWTLDGY